jgi:hypothetical protein
MQAEKQVPFPNLQPYVSAGANLPATLNRR